MTWTKLDDQFHGHPKVQRAWQACPAAIGLHVLAMSHSAAYLTDGRVSEAFVTSMIPAPALRRRALAALLDPGDFDAGLWEKLGAAGWLIHDYLHFNESRSEVQARRADRSQSRAQSGRTGARKRWSANSSTNGKHLSSPYGELTENVGSTNGELMAPGGDGKAMAPSPSPTPVPSPTGSSTNLRDLPRSLAS